MTVRSLLNRIRHDPVRYRRLLEKRDDIYSRIYPGSIRPKHTPVQESAPDDKMLRIMADVDALDKTVTAFESRMRRRRVYAEGIISQITDVRLRQVLEQYYLSPYCDIDEETGKEEVYLPTWGNVSARLKISERWVKQLHGEALKEFSCISGLKIKEEP